MSDTKNMFMPMPPVVVHSRLPHLVLPACGGGTVNEPLGIVNRARLQLRYRAAILAPEWVEGVATYRFSRMPVSPKQTYLGEFPLFDDERRLRDLPYAEPCYAVAYAMQQLKRAGLLAPDYDLTELLPACQWWDHARGLLLAIEEVMLDSGAIDDSGGKRKVYTITPAEVEGFFEEVHDLTAERHARERLIPGWDRGITYSGARLFCYGARGGKIGSAGLSSMVNRHVALVKRSSALVDMLLELARASLLPAENFPVANILLPRRSKNAGLGTTPEDSAGSIATRVEALRLKMARRVAELEAQTKSEIEALEKEGQEDNDPTAGDPDVDPPDDERQIQNPKHG